MNAFTRFVVTKDTADWGIRDDYNVVREQPDGEREFIERRMTYEKAVRFRQEMDIVKEVAMKLTNN
jgi:hypothetical protein